MIGASAEEEPELEPAVEAVARLVEAGAKARKAAQVVAELTGTHANALYDALLERKRG